jgi:hypothetical protein
VAHDFQPLGFVTGDFAIVKDLWHVTLQPLRDFLPQENVGTSGSRLQDQNELDQN